MQEGAQIINMSFACLRDPILETGDQGLEGPRHHPGRSRRQCRPKSPPLFPGADPNVIAVSATDVDDKTYKNANRGRKSRSRRLASTPGAGAGGRLSAHHRHSVAAAESAASSR